MKNLKENIKYGIFEAVASLFALLTFVFTFIPAYFENGFPDMSIVEIMMGNDRIATSGLIIFGFVLLILALLISVTHSVLFFLNKTNDKITTILGIISGVMLLASSIILACSIFISGLDKLNSELGLVQGSWGFKAGTFLVPVAGLIALGFTFPSALIIPHKKDLKDQIAEAK